MLLCWPIAYPIGRVRSINKESFYVVILFVNKIYHYAQNACFSISFNHTMCRSLQLLDYLLGHDDSAFFRRAQLKALVSIHGKEVRL